VLPLTSLTQTGESDFGQLQRPFLYFYCPVFLLYELSSPFLNIHWFCDKLDLTGSIYQAINGALLTSTFFACRICWGQYSSYQVFHDIYLALSAGHSQPPTLVSDAEVRNSRSGDLSLAYADSKTQTTAFMGTEYLPLWLAVTYLASNLVLNGLNIWWFGKMVATIRKRFDPPLGTKGQGPDEVHYMPQENAKGRAKVGDSKPKGSVKAARERAEAETGDEDILADGDVEEAGKAQRAVFADGRKGVEVSGMRRGGGSVKSRRKA